MALFSLSLRVVGSSACRRVRRVVAPAGESLSFVASNESNQSKDAFHFAVPLRTLPSATCRLRANSDHGTPVSTYPTTRLASHRLDDASGLLRVLAPRRSEAWTGKVCEANDRIALGPRGRRRGAQGFGAARNSALRPLTSRRLSERSERSERSEFGARPQTPSTAEQSALGRPPPSGRLFFGDFLLAKQKKVTALSGAHPDAASRSEHGNDKARLRHLSPNGRGPANQASTSSARTGTKP